MKKLPVLLLVVAIANPAIGRNFKCSNVTDGFDLNVNDHKGGQCNVYVRYETGLEWDACHGNAENCYSQAESFGYSVGSTPKLNSILVMGHWSGNSAGHAAIVIDIDQNDSARVKVRDSNWIDTETTGEHWINTNDYGSIGYIYCEEGESYQTLTPQQICNQSSCDIDYTTFSTGEMVGWYPRGNCDTATQWFGLYTKDDGTLMPSYSVEPYYPCQCK